VRLVTNRTLSAIASINALVIDAGHLQLDNNAALTINSGGLLLTGLNTSYTAVSGSGRLVFPDEALLFGHFDGDAYASVDVPIHANTLVYSGGGGAVILNRPNSYTGGTHVQGGLMGAGTQGAIGGGSIELTGGGGLLFTGSSQTYDNPVFIGTPDTTGASNPNDYISEIFVDAGVEATLGGTITSHAFKLSKYRAGVLRLNGDYNAQLGGQIEVADGTLVINGTARSNSSQLPLTIFVDQGTLAGNGTVLGTVNAPFISPGDGIGRLTDQRFTSRDTTFIFELHGLEPGIGYDQLVAFEPTSSSSHLDLLSDFVPAFGDTFLIMDNRYSIGFLGFAGLAHNSIVTASNGAQFRISYTGGDGNDVLLTAVPEPTTIFASLLASGALLSARRRRGSRRRRKN
jgi:fibronectin-binding autotransporter adhesin